MDISVMGTVGGFVRSAEINKRAECVGKTEFYRFERRNYDRSEFGRYADCGDEAEGSADKEKSMSDILREQSERMKSIFGDADEEQERAKLGGIREKVRNGMRLSPAEQEYLSRKDPDAYDKYQQTELARKMYRSMLRCCRTRDQVNSMRLSNAVSALSEFRKSARNGGDGSAAAGMNAAMEREIRDYMSSAEYKKLPTDAECAKFDKDLAAARKYENEKRAAKRQEIIEKRRKSRGDKKKLKKTPGDGKRTVAQVMASPTARKVLRSRANRSGCSSAPFGVKDIYKMNIKA